MVTPCYPHPRSPDAVRGEPSGALDWQGKSPERWVVRPPWGEESRRKGRGWRRLDNHDDTTTPHDHQRESTHEPPRKSAISNVCDATVLKVTTRTTIGRLSRPRVLWRVWCGCRDSGNESRRTREHTHFLHPELRICASAAVPTKQPSTSLHLSIHFFLSLPSVGQRPNTPPW